MPLMSIDQYQFPKPLELLFDWIEGNDLYIDLEDERRVGSFSPHAAKVEEQNPLVRGAFHRGEHRREPVGIGGGSVGSWSVNVP